MFFFFLKKIEIFSSAWLCQQSYYCGAGVHRSSSVVVRKTHFLHQETIKGINAKFCGKVAIQHISKPYFSLLKFKIFLILTNFTNYFSFSLTWDHMGVKISKATPPIGKSL